MTRSERKSVFEDRELSMLESTYSHLEREYRGLQDADKDVARLEAECAEHQKDVMMAMTRWQDADQKLKRAKKDYMNAVNKSLWRPRSKGAEMQKLEDLRMAWDQSEILLTFWANQLDKHERSYMQTKERLLEAQNRVAEKHEVWEDLQMLLDEAMVAWQTHGGYARRSCSGSAKGFHDALEMSM